VPSIELEAELSWLLTSSLKSYNTLIWLGAFRPVTAAVAVVVDDPQLAIKKAVLTTTKNTLKVLISNSFEFNRCLTCAFK
jgi:hypothetical protein